MAARTGWTLAGATTAVALVVGGLQGWGLLTDYMEQARLERNQADDLAEKVQFLEAEVQRLRHLEEPVCRLDPETRWHRGACLPAGTD